MHNASWHKSFYLKYNNSKLAKAKKRSACMSEHEPGRKHTIKAPGNHVRSRGAGSKLGVGGLIQAQW